MTPIEFVTNQAWAIRAEALSGLIALAERNPDAVAKAFASITMEPEMVASKEGAPIPGLKYATIQHGVAEIPVKGVLSRYSSMMSDMCGGTSYQRLATDIAACANDPSVKAILLNVDSPGGTASGMSETSEMIRKASAKKPVVGYVGGQACSAGYGLLSGCTSIVAHKAATLGSIGAMLQVDAKSRPGEHTFISAQSPLKNPNPATRDGSGALQEHVNELAQTFIDTVAENRGQTSEYVAENFGRGGLMLGAKAVECGMADRLGDYESTLAELCRGEYPQRKPMIPVKPGPKAEANTHGASMSNVFQRAFARLMGTDPAAAEAALEAEMKAGAEKVEPAIAAAAAATGSPLLKVVDAELKATEANPKAELAKIEARSTEATLLALEAFFTQQATATLGPLVAAGKLLPADLPAAVIRYVDAAMLDHSVPLVKAVEGGAAISMSRLKFYMETVHAKPTTDLTKTVIPADATVAAVSLDGLKVLPTAANLEEATKAAAAQKSQLDSLMATEVGRLVLKDEAATNAATKAYLESTTAGLAVLASK